MSLSMDNLNRTLNKKVKSSELIYKILKRSFILILIG